MGLLHLVEQHHRVGTAAHRLGELAALVVADVARRGADEACDGMLFAVLAHVNADHRPLVVEQEVSQSLGQFGLTDTRGAEE